LGSFQSLEALALKSATSGSTYRPGPELILGPVDVEHGGDLDEQAPPGPLPDTHELAHILLDAADGDVLDL